MKEKLKKLTTDLKKFHESHYGMIILVSWFVLLVCLIIKLFGGNWFELWWDNKHFINFCNYVDDNIWLKRILACLVYLITTIPVLKIILKKKKLTTKQLILFLPLMISKSIIGWYISGLGFIFDLVIIIIIPIIITKNWKRPILANVLIFLFQLVTILTRNLSAFGSFNSANTVIENLLIQVDYYIMILLYYLYTFNEEKGK